MSRHLCPRLLAAELQNLSARVGVFVSHLKPSQIELTMAEIESDAGEHKPQMLHNNQVFEF